jgi:small-conductance mechanosensitive channel/CRP-like cAMP-binding protein
VVVGGPGLSIFPNTELVTSETVGVLLAIVLLGLVRLLLPEQSRRLMRAPTALLVLHLLARALLVILETGSIQARITSLFGLLFLFASIGRSVVLIALDAVLDPRMARPLPRIFRDIIQGVVYLILGLVALRSAGVEPGSLLTTSALLTAAIALSLQETLGNLVAGLAIQAQQPFDVDDWIQFDADPKHIGRVLEINWRATKVLTLDDVEVVVPNATLAKAPITNFTKPTTASRRSLYIQVPADVAPHTVRDVVMAALPGAKGVLEKPPPTVVMNAFIDGNVEYWIRFHTDAFHLRDGVDSAARERIWYGFARASIPIAAPNRAVHLREVTQETEARADEKELAHREVALGAVDFLRALTDAQRRRLAEGCRIHLYGAGEIVVKQGETTAEMFIVQSGQFAVERRLNGQTATVAKLGPGEFFGEMALMTGEQRTATVRAESPATLIGIDQKAVKALLDAAPELAAVISRVIAERQAASDAAQTEAIPQSGDVETRTSQLLGRIRRFFA